MRTLRVITINLWNDAGPAPRRMQVLLPQLAALQPHVVGLQEVRQTEHLRQAELIARALDGDFRFVAADQTGERGPIGNAIVSRLPILASSELSLSGDLRVALRCEIETPAGPLSFVTTHLTWELDRAPAREAQVLELDAFARQPAAGARSALPTVMTGDFNCTPDSDVVRFLTGRASLGGRGTYWRDAFQRRHPHSDGFTWSARNPFVARNVERDRRIDFIFVGPMDEGGPGAILHARVALDLPGDDGVFASDHFGVFAEIALSPTTDGR